MAALTASSVIRESVGSLTLLIVGLTAQGTSDTYTLYAGAPIVGVFASGTNAGTSATFVQSTGVVTIVNTTGTGAYQLFVLIRG